MIVLANSLEVKSSVNVITTLPSTTAADAPVSTTPSILTSNAATSVDAIASENVKVISLHSVISAEVNDTRSVLFVGVVVPSVAVVSSVFVVSSVPAVSSVPGVPSGVAVSSVPVASSVAGVSSVPVASSVPAASSVAGVSSVPDKVSTLLLSQFCGNSRRGAGCREPDGGHSPIIQGCPAVC